MNAAACPHLVIFDCDGTLIDGQHLVIAAMNEAFKRHGFDEPDDRATRGVIGLSLETAIAALLRDEDKHLADEMSVTFKDAFQGVRADKSLSEPFYDGARELIADLSSRDDVLLAIATGKSRRGVDIMLDREGWQDTFISIQTADSAPSKPHPGMVLNACSQSGVSIEKAIMVGDTTYDIEMARAAHAKAFGVSWGYHDVKSLEAAGAHMILDDYSALDKALNTAFMKEAS